VLHDLPKAVDHAIVALFARGLSGLKLYSRLDHIQRVPSQSASETSATPVATPMAPHMIRISDTPATAPA
jgi:hypothetical protein